jgi:tRNA-modifying protein YgfZ
VLQVEEFFKTIGGDKMPVEKAIAGPLPAANRPRTGARESSQLQARLPDRGVVMVSGPQAKDFLHGLVSNGVLSLLPGHGCYAALLSPQGKILFDFLIVAQTSDTFLLDCPRPFAADLARRLTFYKLRAKVDIADRSDTTVIVATWGDGIRPAASAYRDPRDVRLGWRDILGPGDTAAVPATPIWAPRTYDDHRIRLRIPHAGIDFMYSDNFPHDANMDLLHGIDFNKGCYIGQEVISRVHHRGSSRKRIARVFFAAPAPAIGTPISVAGSVIGVMGSSTEQQGLAMIRVDKAAAALAAGERILADHAVLRVELDF